MTLYHEQTVIQCSFGRLPAGDTNVMEYQTITARVATDSDADFAASMRQVEEGREKLKADLQREFPGSRLVHQGTVLASVYSELDAEDNLKRLPPFRKEIRVFSMSEIKGSRTEILQEKADTERRMEEERKPKIARKGKKNAPLEVLEGTGTD